MFELSEYIMNMCLVHLTVVCYSLYHFYILIISNDKKSYNDYKILLNNKDELKLLIKSKLKLVISEQVLFRVYFVELLSYIFNMNIIAPFWSIMFATYNIYYYKHDNDYHKYIKFAYVFLLSYFILIDCSLLVSCIVHCYAELLIIIIRIYLFNEFNFQPNDNQTEKKITIKNNLNNFIPEKLELANKKEVEDMLSGKKFD